MLDLGQVVVDEQQLDAVAPGGGEQMREPGIAEDVAGLVERQEEARRDWSTILGGSGLRGVDDRGDQRGEVRREAVTLGTRRHDAQCPGAVEEVLDLEAASLDGSPHARS